MDSSLAESMNAQVFTTKTSASSGRDVISIPRCKTLPSMISASTRFLAQPRLIMPTFGFRATPFPFVFISAFDVRRWTLGVFLRPFRLLSVDGYVFVAFFQRLAVSRRHPALERGTPLLVAYSHPSVGSFDWANRDPILVTGFCRRWIRWLLRFG